MNNEPPKTWIITDTHFNHTKMIELCGRPENFTEVIIKNWQKTVGDEDTVIHLGDVIFNRAGELKDINASLPGRKILIRGNHDMERSHWYTRRGFSVVCFGMVYAHAYFTHKPAKILPEDCTVNIHGHLHNTSHRDAEYEQRPWHRLLALENENYAPVLLDSFLARG